MKQKQKRRCSQTRLSKAVRDKLERWDGGVEAISDEMGKASLINSPRPGETPRAILKRGIYTLVRDLQRTRKAQFETALAHVIDKRLYVDFEVNPFHWGLAAASACGELGSDFHNSISEYGTELLYAHRHRIPPELLIGFIHQVGGIKRIREQGERLEHWYREDLPWVPTPPV